MFTVRKVTFIGVPLQFWDYTTHRILIFFQCITMAPRVKSVLVLVKNPGAVEMFKVNEVVPPQATIETGATRKFRRHKEKESYEGKILGDPGSVLYISLLALSCHSQ